MRLSLLSVGPKAADVHRKTTGETARASELSEFSRPKRASRPTPASRPTGGGPGLLVFGLLVSGLLGMSVSSGIALADIAPPPGLSTEGQGEKPAIAPIAEPAQPQIQWQTGEQGPGKLGTVATITIPPGFIFAPQDQMATLNAATGNLNNPNDIGALTPAENNNWLAFFSFDPVGHVKDDDRDSLKADEMLAQFKEGDEAANEMRKEQGMASLVTEGWEVPPYYDPQTNNLTWALRLRSDEGPVINHNIRLLGRGGVMEVVLVCPPDKLQAAVAEFSPMLKGFSFIEGERYTDFKMGDKVAEYGLAGLVLGGGVAVAAKTGLLKVLLKNMKVVALAVVGAGAAVMRGFKALFGKKDEAQT